MTYQPTPGNIEGLLDIKISGTNLEAVEHFPYLGSHLSQKATIEAEIQHRICGASTSFSTHIPDIIYMLRISITRLGNNNYGTLNDI